MKKTLSLFASISLLTTSSFNVVACSGSTHPYVTPTEVDKLYNKLNETQTAFQITDNHFWGNEVNYGKTLLADLEKVAQIPPQDDHYLSWNKDLTPLNNPGIHSVDLNIGAGFAQKTAIVKVDWELTKDQNNIYGFYQDWPKISQKISDFLDTTNISLENGDTDKLLDWWNPQAQDEKYGWDMSKYAKYKTLNLNDPTTLKPMLENIIETTASEVTNSNYADLMDDDLVAPNLSMNLGQDYSLATDPIMMQSGAASFALNDDQTETNAGWQTKPWTIDYDNNYYLTQVDLRGMDKWFGSISVDKSDLHAEPDKIHYYAQHYQNSDIIDAQLEDLTYDNIVDYLTFSGELVPNKMNQIEVYYNKIDQHFTIPVFLINRL